MLCLREAVSRQIHIRTARHTPSVFVHERQLKWVPQKYIIMVKATYHQCESVVNLTFYSGSLPPPRIRFAFQSSPVWHRDGFSDGNIIKGAPWQIMFVDGVVLCAREKGVPELELEQL